MFLALHCACTFLGPGGGSLLPAVSGALTVFGATSSPASLPGRGLVPPLLRESYGWPGLFRARPWCGGFAVRVAYRNAGAEAYFSGCWGPP